MNTQCTHANIRLSAGNRNGGPKQQSNPMTCSLCGRLLPNQPVIFENFASVIECRHRDQLLVPYHVHCLMKDDARTPRRGLFDDGPQQQNTAENDPHHPLDDQG